MSEYTPRPLASKSRTTDLADAEYNVYSALQIVGGAGYSGGAAVGPFPGALGKDNLKTAPWINNDRKTEPYATMVFQAAIPSVPAAGARNIYVPVGSALANAVPVSATVRYAAGPATWNGNVNFRICNSSLLTADFSVTPLTALQYYSTSASALTWTNNSDPSKNYLSFGVSATTGVISTGWIMSIIFKAKHIA